MATYAITVFRDAWTEIGNTPCVIEAVDKGLVTLVVNETAPTDLEAAGHSLSLNPELGQRSQRFDFTGLKVFARTTSSFLQAQVLVTRTGTAPALLLPLLLSSTSPVVGQAFSASVIGRTTGSTLTLSNDGAAGLGVSGDTVSGTPTKAGPIDITETLPGSLNGRRTSKNVATSRTAALAIAGTPGSAMVGTPFNFTPVVSGASGSRTFSLIGSLPAGLSFSTSTGAITGTPTTAGTTSGLSISVTDSTGTVTLSGLSIVVAAAPALQTLTLSSSSATVGASYSATISGATAGSSITISGGGSGGLSVTGSGTTRILSGTPTTAGTVNLVESLSGATGSPRTTTGLLTVAAAAAGDSTRRMFAATRLRFPSVVSTLAGSGTVYNCQSFFIGTPDYPITDLEFLLPTHYGITTGANPSEFANPTAYQFEKLSIKVGNTWYECPTAPFMVDPAVDPAGFVLDPISNVVIPANSMLECRMAWNAPGGSSIAGVTRANDLGEVSMSSTSGSLAAKCTDGSALTANGFARQVMPALMAAKGWDGRPVGLGAGDSIQAGANEAAITGFMSPRGTRGFIERGLDDNTQSKRIALNTIALEGSRPSDWQNRANCARKLDAVGKFTARNGGKPPFTFIISNHGNNSVTVTDLYAALAGFWTMLKTEFPNVPIYHSEMLARPTSTDGFQSLANQSTLNAQGQATADTYPTGARWTVNDKIGKGSPTGDATAQARVDGYIAGSFAAWRPGSYDTGSNRDKLAVVAFDTTLTADSAAGNLTVQLASVANLSLGDMIIGNPGGTGNFDAIVKAIVGNAVTLSGGSSSLLAAGTRFTAALNDRTGLHPGTRHHIKIAMEAVVPWKQFMGWANAVVDPAPLSLANVPWASEVPGSDAYEGGAYLTGRTKKGRTSTAALKDAATATLPTGWQRDTSNKTIILTSSIPTGETLISDWLFQDDWSIRIPASGGTPLNLTFDQNIFKPTKTKSYLIDNRQNGNTTITNNTVGGSIADAAGSPMTFLMHPGGTGAATYRHNAFWNMPEDHIRLSEGGGIVEYNFCFGGGQSQLEDPHYDTIQVLPNVVPRTLKGPITVRYNYFDMRRGIGHTQAVRMADIASIDTGVTITVENNVFVDPNYDISFSAGDIGTVIRRNYFAAQPFPSYQKSGAADYGEYLNPIPSAAIIYDNYRLETGAKLSFEQNRPAA